MGQMGPDVGQPHHRNVERREGIRARRYWEYHRPSRSARVEVCLTDALIGAGNFNGNQHSLLRIRAYVGIAVSLWTQMPRTILDRLAQTSKLKVAPAIEYLGDLRHARYR